MLQAVARVLYQFLGIVPPNKVLYLGKAPVKAFYQTGRSRRCAVRKR
jgi:hypothetical protein